MLSLTYSELRIVQDAAQVIPVDRRSIFMERVAAMRKFRSRTDDDLREIVQLATTGLLECCDGFVTGLPDP